MKLSRSIIGLGLGLACASLSVFAETPLNISIPLSGDKPNLNPSEMDTIKLSALGIGDSYKITCKIDDPNNAKYNALVNISTQGCVKPGAIYDNGKVIGVGYAENAQLNSTSNTIVIDNVAITTSDATLIIKNASNPKKGEDNSIHVSQCVAQGETTSKK